MFKLHVTLRQYRVIPVAVTVFLMFLTWDMTIWYKSNFAELVEWQNAPIMAYLGILVTGLFKSSQIALQRHEKDDE